MPEDFVGIKYLDYVEAIEQGEIVSRLDMARKMGVAYSTAMYHLERAVNFGALNKAVGWCGKQTGWVYAQPETMPRMEGV